MAEVGLNNEFQSINLENDQKKVWEEKQKYHNLHNM